MSPARVAAVVLAVVLTGAACAPVTPPGGGWLAAGCSSNPDSELVSPIDLLYSGTPNVAGNLTLRFELVGTTVDASSDGTCTGSIEQQLTLVRAPDAGSAQALCESLDIISEESPLQLVDSGYDVPVDAWGCVAAPVAA